MTLNDLVAGDLTLRLEESTPQQLVIRWHGKANARRPGEVLRPFFDQLMHEATRTSRTVAFHFEQAAHVNSSTIALTMQLVHRMDAANIPLLITYDADLKWQRMTFGALGQLETQNHLLELRSV